jgi:hypothetical protein
VPRLLGRGAAQPRVPVVVVPMYMSKVMRMPARRETSARSMCQVNRAVVQKKWRRLCQVYAGPRPERGASRRHGARGARTRRAKWRTASACPGKANIRPGGLVAASCSAGIPDAAVTWAAMGYQPGLGGIHGAAPAAALGRFGVQGATDLDDLARPRARSCRPRRMRLAGHWSVPGWSIRAR